MTMKLPTSDWLRRHVAADPDCDTEAMTPPILDAIADKVLRYRPPDKGVSAKNRRTKRQMEAARRGDNDPTGENGLVAAARRIRAKPHAD